MCQTACPVGINTGELVKRLRAERTDLEREVRLLGDSSLSVDLLEERAHVLLGFADPRDYVIRTPPDAR